MICYYQMLKPSPHFSTSTNKAKHLVLVTPGAGSAFFIQLCYTGFEARPPGGHNVYPLSGVLSYRNTIKNIFLIVSIPNQKWLRQKMDKHKMATVLLVH